MEITGGCLCGKIRYSLTHAPTEVFLCHCRQCQKAQGSAYVASIPIPAGDFELTQGAAYLQAYRASPPKARYFCRECGSPIYSRLDGKPAIRLRAGSLDVPPPLNINAPIHTVGRAPWDEINDDYPQFPGEESGRP